MFSPKPSHCARRSSRLIALSLSLGLAASLLAPAAPALAKKKAKPKATVEQVQQGEQAKQVEPVQQDQPTNPAETATGKAPANTAADKKVTPSDPVAKEFEQLSPQTLAQMQALHDALHLEAKGINNEVRDEEELAAKDIAVLWQAAVERSGTIRYAIEKLSNRDATGQPVANDGFTRRMLQNVARLGGVAGSMWTGTPTGMLGGSMVDSLLSGDPNESALQRVTDADMVLLAKEIETLQSRVIDLYYHYNHAEEKLALAQEASRTLGRYYDKASQDQTMQPALSSLMATLYETTRQDEDQARQSFNSARDALSMMVGPDAMTAFEQLHQEDS